MDYVIVKTEDKEILYDGKTGEEIAMCADTCFYAEELLKAIGIKCLKINFERF